VNCDAVSAAGAKHANPQASVATPANLRP